MRHWLLLVLIVLLPLRSWAADGMATRMAAETAAVTSPAATLSGQTPSHALHDCEDRVASVATPVPTADEAAAANGDPCQSCQTCQVCHTMSSLPAWLSASPPASACSHCAEGQATFASADTLRLHRPPIG